MNKAELISHVATSTGISKAKAADAINAFMEAVQTTLDKSDKVTLVGFGTFETSNRQARKGRNPKTGEEISIPAKRVAKFRASSKLLTNVNA
jgi:DNA-binding protein HU-beta